MEWTFNKVPNLYEATFLRNLFPADHIRIELTKKELNKKIVMPQKRNTKTRLISNNLFVRYTQLKFLVTSLSYVVAWFLIDILHISFLVYSIFSIPILFLINYYIQKYIFLGYKQPSEVN